MTGDAVTGAGLDAARRRRRRRLPPHPLDGAAGRRRRLVRRARAPRGRATSSPRASARACAASSTSAASCPRGHAPSAHLASRLAVEDALLGAAPEAVALRASIVISAASRSFRFLVRLVERSPVLPLPAWRDHRTQPIDGRDVIAYLVAAGTSPAVDGPLSLDIAGPDVLTYGELIGRIRDALLLDRPPIELPFSLTPVASVVAAAIAGEDIELIGPLMEGLGGDLLPRDDRAPRAVRRAAAPLRRGGRARAARLGGERGARGAVASARDG